MQVKDWITEILMRHDISCPDQRPLYQYRINGTEFESLKKSIRLSINFGLDAVSKKIPGWNAAFVMYASEWWRREYDGSAWSWDKVFESIGADSRDLSTAQRNVLVETGLQFWRRSIRIFNNRNLYLGSIACEGGLPLNQLNKSSGWLGRVFKQVIPKYSRLQNTGVPADQLIAECDYIPNTYQNDQVRVILGDMVITVVELKRKYRLQERSDPVGYLDRNITLWRELFPLPIETDVGKTLLFDMVKTAAKADDVMTIPMRGIRSLRDDGNVQIRLEFAGFIPLEKLVMPDIIPPRVDVELASGGGAARQLGVALRTDYQQKASLKMPRMSESIQGDKALQGYSIRFKHLSEILKEIPLIGGDELDNEVPWVFAQHNDDWELEGVASISTRAKRVRILYPEHLIYHTDAEVRNLTSMFANKKLFEASGCIRLTDDDANSFTIKTAQDRSSSYYSLQGKLIKFAGNPKELFLGLPTLRRVDHETGVSTEVLAKDLVVRPVNSKSTWQRLMPGIQGVYEIRLHDQGNILFRKKCAILSEQFAVRFKPTANSLDGAIYLDHAKPATVVCELTVKHTITPENDGYRIDLTADRTPPAYVHLTLCWPGMTDMLMLTLPFPARGGQVIDAVGNRHSSRRALIQDQLHGVRLRLFSEQLDRKRQLQIEFMLKDDSLDDIKDVYFRHEIEREGAVVELAIIDYLEWISALLAISRNLDSHVQLAVYENATELLKTKICRYQFSLERNLEQGSVELRENDHASLSCDTLNGIELMAMRLSQPEQEHIKLEPRVSEHTATGSWLFHPERRVTEPWLIYPAKTSSVSLRPILWSVGYEPGNNDYMDAEISTLHSAVIMGQTQARQAAIKNILERMCLDFEHSGWDYLRHLWRHCPHLSMSSFDVWAIAVTDTRILAALVLQMDTAFSQKLSKELPVFWELAPLRDWLAVFQHYKHYLSQQGVEEPDANKILAKRIDKISETSQALDVVAKILKQSLCGITEQDLHIKFLPMEKMTGMVNDLRQELDRRQADSDWPTVLKSELINAWQQLEQSRQFGLKLENIPDHHHAVVTLPVLLALFCANANAPKRWLGNAAPIFKLKRLKAFDEDWFNTIFKWSVAYLSQQTQ